MRMGIEEDRQTGPSCLGKELCLDPRGQGLTRSSGSELAVSITELDLSHIGPLLPIVICS